MAGCLGDDDVDPSESAEEGEPEAGLGTVTGRVLTVGLDPITGASVRLVANNQVVGEKETKEDGTYRIANVEPGQYRLQVSGACCKEGVRGVTVEPDETISVDLRLDSYSSDDLQEPRVEPKKWTGFLACTFRWPTGGVLPASGINACGLTPGATGDDFLHRWEIGPGLKSVVGAMEWRAPGAALGDELAIYMEVSNRSSSEPLYASAEGPSPLEYRSDAGWVVETYSDENIHPYDFDNVQNTLELQFRVFAAKPANIVYQQQFTVYWDLYYWEEAPEGATALPDL